MIGRFWVAAYSAENRRQLLDYANDISLPYLRSQPGNRGVLYFAQADKWITLTLWDTEEDYMAMETRDKYKDISRRIGESGSIDEVLNVEVYDAITVDLDMPSGN